MDSAGQGRQLESGRQSKPGRKADPKEKEEDTSGEPTSEFSYSRLGIFLFLGIVGCSVDLLTKHLAFSRLGLPGGETHWIWDGYFGLQTSINHGALFGLGQGNVPVLAAISIFALVGLGVWIYRGGALSHLGLTIALGMIFGGILGNLYDRLGLWGHAGVRDWILCCYKGWIWPNFNIADSLLVCGAILMMWLSWRDELQRARVENS